jgi:hypothetical protein
MTVAAPAEDLPNWFPEADRLKAYTIAVEALGHHPTAFDPQQRR